MGNSGTAEAMLWGSKEESEAAQVHRELCSIAKCIVAEQERLRGHSVLVLSDAMAAAAYINKGSGPSDEMTEVMKMVFRVCVQNKISLRSEHVKGVSRARSRSINKPAISRAICSTCGRLSSTASALRPCQRKQLGICEVAHPARQRRSSRYYLHRQHPRP